MKTSLVVAAVCAAVAVPALAAEHHHAGHGMAAAAKNDAPADGVVKKVDRAGGKLTVAHGPLPNLNMPPMTMAFRVKDPAWLGRLKEGAKIRFVAENIDGVFTITRLEAN